MLTREQIQISHDNCSASSHGSWKLMLYNQLFAELNMSGNVLFLLLDSKAFVHGPLFLSIGCQSVFNSKQLAWWFVKMIVLDFICQRQRRFPLCVFDGCLANACWELYHLSVCLLLYYDKLAELAAADLNETVNSVSSLMNLWTDTRKKSIEKKKGRDIIVLFWNRFGLKHGLVIHIYRANKLVHNVFQSPATLPTILKCCCHYLCISVYKHYLSPDCWSSLYLLACVKWM